MKVAFLCIMFILLSFQILAESLDNEMKIFVSDLRIKHKSKIMVEEIIHSHTGKKWELSGKIKNTLISALKEQFIVLDKSQEKALQKEREKSISGYSILSAKYILTGSYEIEKEIVKINLKITLIDTSELVASKTIVVDRVSVEMYLKDYSEQELEFIIDKQNSEIRSLLRKQDEKRKRAIKYQQIKQRKDITARLKKGKEVPYSDYNYKLLWLSGGGIFYGLSSFSAANKTENDDKKDTNTIRTLGVLSFIGAAWCIYFYINNKYASLQISPSEISILITKKF